MVGDFGMVEQKSGKKTGNNSRFAEKLKELCKSNGINCVVACVCKQEDKEHGVHRMVMYGNKRHCEELMTDMQSMFAEIGIGQHGEKDNNKENHDTMDG